MSTMKITPQKFAELLRNSTLTSEEQKKVLQTLPRLNSDEIETLAKILEEDVKKQDKIFKTGEMKNDETILKMNIELKKLESEFPKPTGE
ncbi:hypothetical protein HYV57_00555 [Candidatus Peregrinibacteria bacterium]|nr:hypothetical protein [Candidatus Peregrinibacteria bacterium]